MKERTGHRQENDKERQTRTTVLCARLQGGHLRLQRALLLHHTGLVVSLQLLKLHRRRRGIGRAQQWRTGRQASTYLFGRLLFQFLFTSLVLLCNVSPASRLPGRRDTPEKHEHEQKIPTGSQRTTAASSALTISARASAWAERIKKHPAQQKKTGEAHQFSFRALEFCGELVRASLIRTRATTGSLHRGRWGSTRTKKYERALQTENGGCSLTRRQGRAVAVVALLHSQRPRWPEQVVQCPATVAPTCSHETAECPAPPSAERRWDEWTTDSPQQITRTYLCLGSGSRPRGTHGLREAKVNL